MMIINHIEDIVFADAHHQRANPRRVGHGDFQPGIGGDPAGSRLKVDGRTIQILEEHIAGNGNGSHNKQHHKGGDKTSFAQVYYLP